MIFTEKKIESLNELQLSASPTVSATKRKNPKQLVRTNYLMRRKRN